MSSIGPPPTAQPAPPASAPLPTATAPSPPAALSRLPVGAQLDVTALTQTLKGQVQVRSSELGEFLLRTTYPLPQGSKVALQIANAGAQVQLKITGLNDKALGQIGADKAGAGAQAGQAQGAGKADKPAGPTQASEAGAITAKGAERRTPGLRASVVGPPAVKTAGVQPFPNGQRLTLRIASMDAPQIKPAQAQTAQPTGAAAGAAKAASPAALQAARAGQAYQAAQPTKTPSTAAQGVEAGALKTANVAKATPTPNVGALGRATAPTAPVATGQASSGPVVGTQAFSGPSSQPTLSGTVQANQAGAQTLVSTQRGLLALEGKLEAPPGSRLTFQVVSQAPPPSAAMSAAAATAATGASAATGGALSGQAGWPTLEQAMQTLDKADPALAQSLRNAIPQATPRMAAAMAVFANAMRSGGDLNKWPGGDPLKGLERLGAKELAKKLGDEFKELAQSRSQVGGEWRPMALPFLNGAEIEKIQLYVHKDPDDEDDENTNKGKEGTRFLIDLNLSTLGEVQLDGFVAAKDKKFDMIIRTKQTFDADVKRGLQAVFIRSLEALGMVGGASFTVAKEFVNGAAPPEPMSNGEGFMV